MKHHRQSPSATLLLAPTVALALSACAGAGGLESPSPAPSPAEPVPEARGVPGFDTRDYPGDRTMALWLEESPYRWVGYYLPAPCYTGTSWQGKRDTLREMGWGLALLFVGEQDWPEQVDETPDAAADPANGNGTARCTRANLSGDRGRADGAAAAAAARNEGFPAGTVVYLDVEPVESVSDSLAAYVKEWARELANQGYEAGLYAHARNAEALMAVMDEPRLWVASPGGFSLRRGPTESGFPATIWQGVLDTDESWGGVTLRIDRNVADRAHPSG